MGDVTDNMWWWWWFCFIINIPSLTPHSLRCISNYEAQATVMNHEL